MAKEKDEPSDYIDQLHWQAQHRRRMPVRFEPKWKYKIVYRFPKNTLFDRIFQFLLLIGVAVSVIYAISFVMMSDQVELPGKIFFCVIIAMIATIIFFAIRDGSEDDDDDDSKHVDE